MRVYSGCSQLQLRFLKYRNGKQPCVRHRNNVKFSFGFWFIVNNRYAFFLTKKGSLVISQSNSRVGITFQVIQTDLYTVHLLYCFTSSRVIVCGLLASLLHKDCKISVIRKWTNRIVDKNERWLVVFKSNVCTCIEIGQLLDIFIIFRPH